MDKLSKNIKPSCILLVEDHKAGWEGTKMLLKRQLGEDTEVLCVPTPEEAIALIVEGKHKIDLVLLDLFFRGKTYNFEKPQGLEVAAYIKQLESSYRNIKIIVVTSCMDGEIIHSLYSMGVEAYLSKFHRGSELIAAIHAVSDGKMYYKDEIFEKMNDYILGRPEFEKLNERETEILLRIANGFQTKQIPDIISPHMGKANRKISKGKFISKKTVEAYRSSLMRKLKADNAPHLVARAFKLGILKPENIIRKSEYKS